MFLFDPTFGNSFERCETEVRRLMERAEAELIFCSKWDERRLAYRIKGRKRGVYVLTCFEASADKIVGLERDAKISEDILRLLVLRADGTTREMLEEACVARGEERVAAPTEAEATAKKVETEVPVAKEESKDEVALVDAVEDDGLKEQTAAEPESSIKE
jgi:ribosomal protein S6